MSTSARVSSKRFIRIGLFWMSETKGRNHEDTNRGCCLSIALHPKLTDDSEQALDLFPNRCEFSYRCGFGGLQKSPFCTGILSSSDLRSRLLMSSAPLPRTFHHK